MPKFVKKPIEVNAERFMPEHGLIPRGVQNDGHGWYVRTIQGQEVPVTPGEWIIAESDGEHYYPCDGDEFWKLYELKS